MPADTPPPDVRPAGTAASNGGGRLGVIGLGLIGGSLALAAKRAGWHVSAYNRSPEVARRAAQQGRIDAQAEDIAALAGSCDIIFIAVPMGAYDAVLGQLAPALAPAAVVTDGGSTKQDTLAAVHRQLGEARRRFVPAHPIAGKEQSGWDAASAALFENHLTILCPEQCDEDALAAVTRLWQQAGARTHCMSAAAHDAALASVSHLPHLLAYALVSAIDKHGDSAQLLQFAAGGFRDFTRIAGSHPDMWRDICLANSPRLLDAIDWYQRELAVFSDYIRRGDGEALQARFDAARALRREWLNTLEQ